MRRMTEAEFMDEARQAKRLTEREFMGTRKKRVAKAPALPVKKGAVAKNPNEGAYNAALRKSKP